MGKFILGFIAGVIVVPAIVYLYFSTGSAPVATSAHAMPFEKMLARKALHVIVEREMPKNVPIEPNVANFAAGAQIYIQNCAVCHGLPGQSETAIARGMYPMPPQLFKGKGVTDDSASETYWKVAHGIRMTGMPGFEQSLSETRIWQVSLMLAKADQLPAEVQQILAQAH